MLMFHADEENDAHQQNQLVQGKDKCPRGTARMRSKFLKLGISRPIDSNIGSISSIDYNQTIDNTLSDTGVTHKAAGL